MSSLFKTEQTRHSLSDFVLGYCRQMGAIVEPPTYGIHNVLLPEDIAAQLGVPSFLCLAFDEQAAQGGSHISPKEITLLHYGHPLVERLVEHARQQAVCTRMYISNVRLDKRDLIQQIRQALSFPNARLFPVPSVVEKGMLCHYVRFNFKANLITDEKHELILPVWMYVQGGYVVDGQELEGQASLEAKGVFARLVEMPLVWRPDKPPLSQTVLGELLERARGAALEHLAEPLGPLQRRSQRFLELDEARLEQYYDDLQHDLERRIQRADDDRRKTLENKLATVGIERQAKLVDAREKYRLRVTLELINLLLVVQPQVVLPVEIKNRESSVTRRMVWDPLRQQLELPVCDVCGRPLSKLWLCTGGHLVHRECLLPQCVDCKRVYCRLCAEQVESCVVCGRPVCVHSLHTCATCGRGTCREHIDLCHAADGDPLLLVQDSLPAADPEIAPDEPAAPPSPGKEEPASLTPKPPRRTQKKEARPQRRRTTSKQRARKQRGPKAQRIDVYAEMDQPLVTAYVIASKQTIACRIWELGPEGISVFCKCEKIGFCREDGHVYYPAPAEEIEAQLEEQIRRLRQEYKVPAQRVKIHRVVHGRPQFERRLMLFGQWKDPEALAQARDGFDRL